MRKIMRIYKVTSQGFNPSLEIPLTKYEVEYVWTRLRFNPSLEIPEEADSEVLPQVSGLRFNPSLEIRRLRE